MHLIGILKEFQNHLRMSKGVLQNLKLSSSVSECFRESESISADPSTE